ncbi:MAG TPA: ArsA family ATPase [Chloroflexota bacterium]|nr:ArsA family ATPase [Chloroflexota bacterium]
MPSSPIADARFLFFGGKGGAGKTTCAAAAALVESGSAEVRVQRSAFSVLALSLDPAHSLRDVLGQNPELKTLNSKLRVQNSELTILELDAPSEFRAFMDRHREELRTIADRGTYFDDEDIQGFLDLSLPGLDEIMGLLKLGELARESGQRRVVVDLPPTGHALRLFDVSTAFDQLVEALELMQGKHRFAVSSLTRRYAEDAIDRFLDDLRASCQAARDALFASGVSAFVLVARPEPMVLAETARYAVRLRELGVPPVALVLNLAEAAPELPPELCRLPLAAVPRLARPPVGREGLAPVAAALGPLLGAAPKKGRVRGRRLPASPTAVGEEQRGGIRLLLEQPRRLMIFGGKGGVGKTTLAAATALGLARSVPDRSVVVVSIDPAHSLGDSFGQRLGDEPQPIKSTSNLLAIELDPEQHWREFKEHWAAEAEQMFQGLSGSGHLDPVYDRQIAARLGAIRPPGLDEVQAATSVIDLLDQDPARLVVVDSAPTGHLLRFLESPGVVLGWAKELMRMLVKYGLASQLKRLSEDLLDLSRKTRRLDALLHDRDMCEVVVVAMAEAPVIAETERLILRLRAMQVPVRRLVWNQAERQTQEAQALEKRHPELQILHVQRRGEPIQGLTALEELAA